MRQAIVFVITALVAVMVAIWGTIGITAKSSKYVHAAPASISIDVMEMMKNARNLPEEAFEAH